MSSVYSTTMKNGVPYCSCLAWKYSRGSINEKTCKHVKKLFPDYVAEKPIVLKKPSLALFSPGNFKYIERMNK